MNINGMIAIALFMIIIAHEIEECRKNPKKYIDHYKKLKPFEWVLLIYTLVMIIGMIIYIIANSD